MSSSSEEVGEGEDGGGFYGDSRKRRRKDRKERDLYGVFYEDLEGPDPREPQFTSRPGGSKRKAQRGADYSKPVGFVSGGTSTTVTMDDKLQNSNRDAAEALRGGGLGSHSASRGGLGARESPTGEDLGVSRGGLGLGAGPIGGMPTSFGESILRAADRRREEATKRASGSGRKEDPRVAEIGSFERHTKGIGMKLLQKMGYQKGKGLGRGNKGIAAPVEAKLRPKVVGLGFGEPQEEAPKEPEPVRKKPAQAKPAKMWQKTKRAAREKVRYKTADEMLEEGGAGGQAGGQTIIDMRGPQSRVVAKMERLQEVDMDAMAETTPMPELQYNLRLVVDLAESKLQKLDHEVRQERETARGIADRMATIEGGRGQGGEALGRLRGLADGVAPLAARAGAVRSLGEAAELLGRFRDLRERYPTEFVSFDVGAIASNAIYPALERAAAAWKPLEECPDLREALELAAEVVREGDGSVADPFSLLLRDTVCFQLQRYVGQRWDPLDPDELIGFLDRWAKVFPGDIRSHILGEVVLPRLAKAVDAWNPSTEGSVPIHVWVHPWLPFLDSRLQELYPAVRHKLAGALKSREPSDATAPGLVSPWRSVFDQRAWDKLVATALAPRLERILVGLDVGPGAQGRGQFDRLRWVLMWSHCVPTRALCALLSKHFFPKLLRALYAWLRANPDFGEVAEWYEGWKACFGEDLEAQDVVRDSFNDCLVMMNAAVSGDDISLYDPSRAEEEARRKEAARGTGTARSTEFDATLKDLVESFGIESGFEFLPKVGRFNKSLQVYSFGGVSITLDNRRQAIEALLEGKWGPVSLERLRQLAEARQRAAA